MNDITIRRFEAIAWADGAPGEDAERLAAAQAAGYRRKQLLRGEGDTFLTYVEMGPGFTVEPHSHDAPEVIYVLAGSLRPSGPDEDLTRGDSLVVPEGVPYGFRCGADGVKFLIVRPGDAGIRYTA